MKIRWEDYLIAIKREDPLDYYTEIYGSRNIAQLAVIIESKKEIENDLDERYRVITNIDDMVFGQFISAEKAITAKEEKIIGMELLSYAIIRPLQDIEFDNTDTEKEIKLIKSIRDEDAFVILNELQKYAGLRKRYVHGKYNGVFYKIYNGEDDDDDDDPTEEDLTAEVKFSNEWYWYVIMRSLALEDMDRYEQILMTKMSEIAPELAFRRQRDIIEDARRRRQEQINNAQSRR